MRAWRNWQTRTVQVRMGATPWRFKSSRPHHLKLSHLSVAFFIFWTIAKLKLTARESAELFLFHQLNACDGVQALRQSLYQL